MYGYNVLYLSHPLIVASWLWAQLGPGQKWCHRTQHFAALCFSGLALFSDRLCPCYIKADPRQLQTYSPSHHDFWLRICSLYGSSNKIPRESFNWTYPSHIPIFQSIAVVKWKTIWVTNVPLEPGEAQSPLPSANHWLRTFSLEDFEKT